MLYLSIDFLMDNHESVRSTQEMDPWQLHHFERRILFCFLHDNKKKTLFWGLFTVL